MSRPKSPRIMRSCEGCQETFEVTPGSKQRFHDKACSNRNTAALRAASRRPETLYKPSVCPCGSTILPSGGRKYVYGKKYCSPECRATHGKKRPKDPSKYVTFTCQNEKCGKEVTRRKSQGSHMFCSSACAHRHTRTRKNVVIRDCDVVLDSGWEALFWGVCAFDKIPCERYDRERGVAWGGDRWYAPDFWLPTLGIAVEIKGQEDDDDPERWEAWTAAYGHRLLVLGRWELGQLLLAGSRERWLRGSEAPAGRRVG